MLIQFNFNNFRCFKAETSLSLLASEEIEHSSAAVKTCENYSVLKSVVVYGANASGKTKLFDAFSFMDSMVCSLARNKFDWHSKYVPFALDENRKDSSSCFEVVFIQNGIQYRYGFEINESVILAEWLFRQGKNNEISIFYRDDEGVQDYHGTYIKAQIVNTIISANMLRKDALFLTVLPVWNNSLAENIIEWFFSANVLSATSVHGMAGFSIGSLKTPMKEKVVTMLKSADINIEDLSLREANIDELPEEIRKMLKVQENKTIIDGVNTKHRSFDSDGLSHSTKSFSLETDESYGTYRLFALSAPIIDTLENGKVLFIDEIDNGLHSDLLRAIVELFQNEETNKHNAQLILNTHDIGLLDDKDLYLHDQIYICQKNRFGESTLTPLLAYQLETDKTIGQMYREGRFGGVPYLVKFMKNVLSSK